MSNQDSGPFGFSKYYKQSLRKEQYWYFFPGEPKISEINKFYKWNAVARYVTFCSLKMLGTGCSSKVAILLLLSKNTKNFKNKLPLDSGFTLRFRTFWKCFVQFAPRKELYYCFFPKAPVISRTNLFFIWNWCK